MNVPIRRGLRPRTREAVIAHRPPPGTRRGRAGCADSRRGVPTPGEPGPNSTGNTPQPRDHRTAKGQQAGDGRAGARPTGRRVSLQSSAAAAAAGNMPSGYPRSGERGRRHAHRADSAYLPSGRTSRPTRRRPTAAARRATTHDHAWLMKQAVVADRRTLHGKAGSTPSCSPGATVGRDLG